MAQAVMSFHWTASQVMGICLLGFTEQDQGHVGSMGSFAMADSQVSVLVIHRFTYIS
jgi:hypothetical protein